MVAACGVRVAMYQDELLMIMGGAFKARAGGGQAQGPGPWRCRVTDRRPNRRTAPPPACPAQADGGAMYRWVLREQGRLCPGACWRGDAEAAAAEVDREPAGAGGGGGLGGGVDDEAGEGEDAQ